MSQTDWIWLDHPQPGQTNQYAQFWRVFDVAKTPASAELRLSVDGNFAAWLNGQFLHTGQFSDFPDQRTYGLIDLLPYLQPGKNTLTLLVCYGRVGHFSYLPGDAGVWFEVACEGQTIARSDSQTLGRIAPDYQLNLTARISPQRGFTFHYDSRKDDGWREMEYCDSTGWRPAVMGKPQAPPTPRPVAMLQLLPPRTGPIIAQGLLKRTPATDQTVGQLMQLDYLSARRSWELFVNQPPVSAPANFPIAISSGRLEGSDGVYLVVDLGGQECGFINLELSTEGGCTVDIAVGEHLDDLRVRSHIGGRNFAARYSARPGRQRFTHYLERFSGRYIQLHLTGLAGTVELLHAGLIPAMYPVEMTGDFHSSDSLHNRIWNLSRRTLHLCMHEHYEDCPWREQALYNNDSRNQMLCGYYTFGNYSFARASLNLLARTTSPDGYQELCAPMTYEQTIPSFTMVWLLAMNDYLMYSGDRQFIAGQMPRIKGMIKSYLATLTDGLFPCPRGARYWQFYDWAEGLDGTVNDNCTRFEILDQTRFDAPLNFFLILALRAVANMADHIGQADFSAQCLDAARSIQSTSHHTFWNQQQQAYQTYVGTQTPIHFAELTQSLALLAGVDPGIQLSLQKNLMTPSNGWVAATLSQSFYKYEALLLDRANGSWVLNDIARTWSAMVYSNATTFWETSRGGWDFHHAGSLCHGWSAIPAYFYGAYGLGLKPLLPGQQKIQFNPGLPFPELQGIHPTPAGPVQIHLQDQKVEIYPPQGVRIITSS